ncbi:response regulator [Paenibacillus sp. strain BS8-2]
MLKVLVVDDDKLARRGIISEMPWELFGMTVVGEANNGVTALEFMEKHKVDLLVTDIAMPIMSGLELMRRVQQLYSNIYCVALTFHQDFEIIQEALRIGAIDYIAKVQIEETRMEEVLGRISGRIQRSPQQVQSAQAIEEMEDHDEAIVFIALGDHSELSLIKQLPFLHTDELNEVSLGIWSAPIRNVTIDCRVLKEEVIRTNVNKQWMILRIKGLLRVEIDSYRKSLLVFKEKSMFYEMNITQVIHTYQAEQLKKEYPGWGEADNHFYRTEWSSLLWTIQPHVFNELVSKIKEMRPSVAQLESVFYAAQINWRRIVPEEASLQLEVPKGQLSWQAWEAWLKEAGNRLSGFVKKEDFSNEITQSIMLAIDYINHHFEEDILHSDLARKVNMSKGYFSLCFKNIIGKNFKDYIREIRMENAQLLLEQTSHSIYRIAEQCGYPNEKYFSRVFLSQVGMLPSEYRLQYNKLRQ